MNTVETESVQCPTCWEIFSVPAPAAEERPCEVDYDCEVCCRPLRIEFHEESGASAHGLAD